MKLCRKRYRKGRRQRLGTTLAELVVAGVLLITALSIVGTCAASFYRLLRDGDNYRTAVAMLSNRLEELTVTPADEVAQSISDSVIPEHLVERFPDGIIEGEMLEDESGTYIALRVQWARPGNPPPIQLVGRLPSTAAPALRVEAAPVGAEDSL